MSLSRRATVYFEPGVYRALRLRAAAGGQTVSAFVNRAVSLALADDTDDLAAFDNRRAERSVPFAAFLKGLRRRGRR